MNPIVVRRIESGLIAGVVVLAIVLAGLDWWWLFVLFLAFDVSALGYLAGPRIGAFCYNIVHSYAGAAIALGVFLLTGVGAVGVVAFAWIFHVAVDRALGFGLKHPDAFEHTDLGMIGKATRKRA
jgi:Domain of unknown function (DUF4260)